MATQEIPPARWSRFFDSFSRDHAGDAVRVEVLRADIGAQLEIRTLRLNGITAEPTAITIAAGDQPDDHIGHVVVNPTRVQLKQDHGRDEVLEIEAADQSKTLLYLT